jgi:hypothetical protein
MLYYSWASLAEQMTVNNERCALIAKIAGGHDDVCMLSLLIRTIKYIIIKLT